MNIALLSVGTEILLGDTVNTNLASLGQALYNNGFILSTEKTVPDDKKLIQDAVNELLENNDVIITCGGIGPTEDDFTKEIISEMFDLKLVVDEDHLSWMKSRWESRGMTMPATNVKQAEIPAGAIKLNNTNGTSPGIYIEYKSKHVFILPGPPREFIPLVTDELVPFLEDNFTKVEKDYEFILFFNILTTLVTFVTVFCLLLIESVISLQIALPTTSPSAFLREFIVFSVIPNPITTFFDLVCFFIFEYSLSIFLGETLSFPPVVDNILI